jgi:short-subunit dehydrogenase
MKRFRGCTALITGASAGLGKEMARQLAPHAGTLILTARRVDRLETLKTKLETTHGGLRVLVYGLDLLDEEAIDTFVTWLRDENLRVGFLINNAGLGDRGSFATSDWERIRPILAVNVVALTKLTHRLLPTLRNAPAPAILNVSSIASLVPVPSLAVYAATKAYVTSFTEALRAELYGTGVTVTALCPGPVDTEFDSVAGRGGRTSIESPAWFKVPAEKVVREAFEAVAADRARVIPGWIVALSMTAACAIPMCLLRLALRRIR